MHPYLLGLAEIERQADLRRAAESGRVAREAHAAARSRAPAAGDQARVTLRLDRVWDSSTLYDLADLNGCRLAAGSHVVAEVDGRIVAALPLDGGKALADPFVATMHLLPLLEVRAAQIRRVEVAPRRLRRLLLRRA